MWQPNLKLSGNIEEGKQEKAEGQKKNEHNVEALDETSLYSPPPFSRRNGAMGHGRARMQVKRQFFYLAAQNAACSRKQIPERKAWSLTELFNCDISIRDMWVEARSPMNRWEESFPCQSHARLRIIPSFLAGWNREEKQKQHGFLMSCLHTQAHLAQYPASVTSFLCQACCACHEPLRDFHRNLGENYAKRNRFIRRLNRRTQMPGLETSKI